MKEKQAKADNSQTIEYVICSLLGIVEILLISRLAFKLAGISPENGFVGFIYSMTQIFILPFSGISLKAITQGLETTAVFETSTLVAITIYAVLFWMILQIGLMKTFYENIE